MNPIKHKNDLTYDQIDELFFEFIDKRKIYLLRGMNTQRVSRMMGVPVDVLNDYVLNEYDVLLEKVIHHYRIAYAGDLWNKSPRMSISSVAKCVGYATVFQFMYRFISHHKCIPYVWKRRYGII